MSAASSSEPREENTVNTSELSEKSKNILETSLLQGSYTQRRSLPKPLRTNQYVQSGGEIYALNFEYRDIHKNRIRPMEIQTEGDIESDAVSSYSRLPAVAQQIFDYALENGSFELTGGNLWEFDFGDRYVERDGTYYLLQFTHMDIPQYSLSPSKVDKA
ncbi:hypothetical protein [Haladaptatus cibarius]|uniref:hypothetical protein n=1 Tax=Haladaptatus cibarius TaxID=453847 RepID=UPI0011868993|nr:hypothetical protein [Haladaptatus cibarius]